MSNRSKFYLAIFPLAMIAVAVIVWPREPRYEGKSLTYWLKRQILSDVGLRRDTGPYAALQEIGTDAIPWLLQKLQYRESPFERKIAEWAAKYPRLRLRFPTQREVNWQGATGFNVLGDKAVTAIPALKQLMQSDDDRLAHWALVSASNMGTNSIPILIHALTNQHADVRSDAAYYLGSRPELAGVEKRKLAIPVLLALLNDPSESARINATNALRKIDPAVAEQVGIKRR